MKNLKIISLGIAMLINYTSYSEEVPTKTLSFYAFQEKTINGTVTSDGVPLPGATISIAGTQQGTQTDEKGKYSLKAKQGDVLEFSFLGKATKVVTVGAGNVINVVLATSSNTIETVQIVGALGIKKRKNSVTSSQVRIKGRELRQASNPNVVALTGKVSGLQVNSAPSSSKIILRGNRSVSGDNNALIVIDGQISSSEILAKIPPTSIQDVNVVKGAQGAALFGEQGENGVVIVNTRDDYGDLKLKKKIEIKPIEIDTDEYDSFVENPFENSVANPLSTFSIDVDNASYTNIRKFINNGQTVPKDAVRVEEMMNFFKYSYAKPKNDDPFSIHTEYGDCPWNTNHKLVKIGLQGKEIPTDNLPNSNFVFLIDVSGSMSGENKLPLVIESLKILTKQLRKEDKISIVVYAGAAGLVLPATSGNDKEKIIAALEKLEAGGSTAGGEGIKLAYKIAEENFIKGGNNQVIIATDGDFNVGASSDNDMISLIEEKRKSDVFLTCLGYGMGNYKDSKLEKLADKGNGNYAYIDNMQEANRFLVKEFKGSMFAIAKDVKIQIEFNPKHVQNYRLIGYENRKLRNEDFTNDAIDAGELGSGHTVTALYEIIPIGVKSDFSIAPIDLKYSNTKTENTALTNELATIKFRYKKPDGNKSIEIIQTIENNVVNLENCSEDFKFCSAVAWFGLKLRDSKLVTNKNKSAILELATKSKAKDIEGYRSEFIRLVESVN
ncbi:YfbK domain-containing protein [Flavobacterium facile]|uniref:YfbK domain-containing protein n=1 Tax=Flavobacterium facile TaxID=2893174 RepID=UPI002E7775A1|nr:von Willebrand factor type A domain-containing protein [Flavobacterium sp. T-12]